MWAFGKLVVKDEALMRAVGRRAKGILEEFKPQDVSNTVWTFATLKTQDNALVTALGRRAEWIV